MKGCGRSAGSRPIQPESLQKYLESKFGDALDEVYGAMLELARSIGPSRLAEKAYGLYEKFPPAILPGKKGWGAAGKLDLESLRRLAHLKEEGHTPLLHKNFHAPDFPGKTFRVLKEKEDREQNRRAIALRSRGVIPQRWKKRQSREGLYLIYS